MDHGCASSSGACGGQGECRQHQPATAIRNQQPDQPSLQQCCRCDQPSKARMYRHETPPSLQSTPQVLLGNGKDSSMCWDCANTSITTKARRDLVPGVAIYTCTMTTDSLRATLQRGCLLERPRVDGAVRRPQFLACPACAAQPARTRQPVPWQGQGRISCGSCAKPRSALHIAHCVLRVGITSTPPTKNSTIACLPGSL